MFWCWVWPHSHPNFEHLNLHRYFWIFHVSSASVHLPLLATFFILRQWCPNNIQRSHLTLLYPMMGAATTRYRRDMSICQVRRVEKNSGSSHAENLYPWSSYRCCRADFLSWARVPFFSWKINQINCMAGSDLVSIDHNLSHCELGEPNPNELRLGRIKKLLKSTTATLNN